MRKLLLSAALAPLFSLNLAIAADDDFNSGFDKDNDGRVSLEEFVLFMAERDVRMLDKNGDNKLSADEWVGPEKLKYRAQTLKKFNADKNDEMNADEIIQVYLWTFERRDKNGDGVLTRDELPHFMRVRV